ncbi:hypothetical protein AVT69_gp267 [Pseudomonas phage PhiPA3]|uniref:Uncharacterized protein 269 n=1 Tax=Pseudomonas phage PhiPA3 TaxID=998086 RepID=F8SJM6_BPPA3|nr:hypothetical protein AVT69_gp267 [Pseudomonas phage PhiPA3]AEH03692.1 hypothetical protein [Pseudomonas phage PhiPA3]
MQCFTHVTRLLVVAALVVLPLQAKSAEVVDTDGICHMTALLDQATAEARDRGDTVNQQQGALLALQKGYGVKNKDNVLYSVLPKAIQEVRSVYQKRQPPKEAYVTAYNACMSDRFNRMVAAQ